MEEGDIDLFTANPGAIYRVGRGYNLQNFVREVLKLDIFYKDQLHLHPKFTFEPENYSEINNLDSLIVNILFEDFFGKIENSLYDLSYVVGIYKKRHLIEFYIEHSSKPKNPKNGPLFKYNLRIIPMLLRKDLEKSLSNEPTGLVARLNKVESITNSLSRLLTNISIESGYRFDPASSQERLAAGKFETNNEPHLTMISVQDDKVDSKDPQFLRKIMD